MTLKSVRFACLVFTTPFATQILAAVPEPPSNVILDDEPASSIDLSLIFHEGLEGPVLALDPKDGTLRKVLDGAGIVEVSSTRARENSRSLHVRIQKNGSTNIRQEARIKSPTDSRPIDGSTHYWYGESVYVPSTSSLVSDSVITQWHTHDPYSGHSPVLGTRIRNGNWYVSREATSHELQQIGPVQTNRWTDWVYHVVWRTNNTGSLQVWKDGKLVTSRSNLQTTASGETNQPYLLIGRYTSSWKSGSNTDRDGTVQESWHDAMRVCVGSSCSYGDVAAR